MKYILLLSLIYISQSSFANEEVLELNAENLTMLALKNSPDDILNDYALHVLKTHKIKDYFKFRKDKNKIKELVNRERKIIDSNLKNIPNKQKFMFAKQLSYRSYDKDKSSMNLGSVFQGNIKNFFRAEDGFSGLPNYFIFLIPNIKLQNNIQINRERFERRFNHLKSISQANSKSIYVEYILSFEKFQNQQSFQTVIDRIDVYTSSSKKTILGTAVEKQNHSTLINDWLLSDGYTNPLIGIHGFHFSHNRLQDQLISADILKDLCAKTKKIGLHTVIVCKKPFSTNSDIVINYLGGKIAQIDVVSHGKLKKVEISRIQNDIKVFLRPPKLDIDYNVVQWSNFNVDFTLFSDAFNHKTSKRSVYSSLFEATPSKNDRTLILSMMADGTKKLLTDLGVKL